MKISPNLTTPMSFSIPAAEDRLYGVPRGQTKAIDSNRVDLTVARNITQLLHNQRIFSCDIQH